jgi:hypothetical protein
MKILYDIHLMKVGCALLQAIHHCPNTIVHLFPPNTWFLAPTPDMKVYTITEEQLNQLVKMTEREHETKRILRKPSD